MKLSQNASKQRHSRYETGVQAHCEFSGVFQGKNAKLANEITEEFTNLSLRDKNSGEV